MDWVSLSTGFWRFGFPQIPPNPQNPVQNETLKNPIKWEVSPERFRVMQPTNCGFLFVGFCLWVSSCSWRPYDLPMRYIIITL